MVAYSEHSQGVHPSEVKLKWPGRQSLQVVPPMPGLQGHWPRGEQMGEVEPVASHAQSVLE